MIMGNYDNGNGNKCPICGKENISISCFSASGEYLFYNCPDCGKFFAADIEYDRLKQYPQYYPKFKYNANHLKSYLFYHETNDRAFLIPQKDYEALDKSMYAKTYNLTNEMVENWYPKNFAEKIDNILLKIYSWLPYDGCKISIDYKIVQLFFYDNKAPRQSKKEDAIDERTQVKYILDYLKENKYIIVDDYNANVVQLTPKALERIYELQKYLTNNKNVFVAMSFNPAIENIYNAINLAIRKAECEVVSMKHRIHNKQIVPEMLRLIKESKILVMDISEPNFGAYYEAGYAQGLGKEVIITCKSSVMKKDKFPCNDKKGAECELLKKYSKPHFDIAQKQILVWEDETDLTEQLTEWIKFLVG